MSANGLLEESLKVVCWRLRMVLDTTPGYHNVLLVRVICFLVVTVVVASRDCNQLRALILPLLAALGILLGALDGNVGWRRSAAAGDYFPIT
jgi:hypothetical protein